jgi:hypothetical protein
MKPLTKKALNIFFKLLSPSQIPYKWDYKNSVFVRTSRKNYIKWLVIYTITLIQTALQTIDILILWHQKNTITIVQGKIADEAASSPRYIRLILSFVIDAILITNLAYVLTLIDQLPELIAVVNSSIQLATRWKTVIQKVWISIETN